jgi:hypothetical protein
VLALAPVTSGRKNAQEKEFAAGVQEGTHKYE